MSNKDRASKADWQRRKYEVEKFLLKHGLWHLWFRVMLQRKGYTVLALSDRKVAEEISRIGSGAELCPEEVRSLASDE